MNPDLRDEALDELQREAREWLVCFRYEQLPPRLQEVSRDFARLALTVAHRMIGSNVSNRQSLMALEHLLIAKDAAVRAAV